MSKVVGLNNNGEPAYELWIDDDGLHIEYIKENGK